MSRQRARARAAREAEQAAERERAARRRARSERLARLRRRRPERSRPQRRYGAMPMRVQLGLAFGWVVTQWVFWQFTADTRTRIGLAVVSALALPLLVVLLPGRVKR